MLLESEADIHHPHWSPDGQSIIYERFEGGQFDLWVLPTSEGSEPWPYLESEFSEEEPQFSPDGRWMAYASAESGRLELFVRSFPEAAGKRQVSTSGGDQPRWRADGKELFYLALDGTLMAVPTDGTGNTFETGSARPLFQTGISPRAGGYRGYDVTGDGERFLLRVRETAASVTVVLNWTAELEN